MADGRITDLGGLDAWLRGRLATAGLVDASMAAATCVRIARVIRDEPRSIGGDGAALLPADSIAEPTEGGGTAEVVRVVHEVDDEAGARISPAPLREASRKLGRQLLRAADRCWPGPIIEAASTAFPGGLHQAVAFGVVAVSARLSPLDAAHLVLHHTVATPAQAAVRLLGLDPFAVTGLQAGLADEAALLGARAVAAAEGPLRDLPALTGPVVDIAATEHARMDMRLFAT